MHAMKMIPVMLLAAGCGTERSSGSDGAGDGGPGDASKASDAFEARDAPLAGDRGERDRGPSADQRVVAPDGVPPTFTCPSTGLPGPSSPKTAKVPAAYLARTYAEALGRLPDQGGWNYYLGKLKGMGCSAASLQWITALFFKSAEFLGKPYTNRQRLLALIRGALGREPTQTDLDTYLPQLEQDPAAWCAVVDQVLRMAEYPWMAKDHVCVSGLANFHREDAFPPLAIAGILSQADLEQRLTAAGAGGTVALPESQLVSLSATLVVPAGVTLTTQGLLGSGGAGRAAYARMARLVRKTAFDGPLVRLMAGAQLSHVWLDGRRKSFSGRYGNAQNVFLEASDGAPSRVTWIRSDNPLGPQNIRFNGSSNTNGCSAKSRAEGNLVLNVSNDNRLPGSQWSDGIFTLCESSVITRNEILDASDVALIAFFSMNSAPQASQITENRVLQAGNDAFAALGTDPWSGANGSCQGDCEFAGLTFDNNTLWTGPDTRFVIGISAGTRAWSFINPHGNGWHARYTNNTSGQSRVRVQLAIYVSGMFQAYLDKNWDPALIDYVDPAKDPAVPPNNCGYGATLANMSYASGTLQGAVNANRDNCI